MQRLWVVLVIMSGCVAATAPATAQETLRIGLISAFSGQFAEAGVHLDNGVKLYTKQHGDEVAGKKIEIIRKDTGGVAPDVTKRLAQELVVRDRADILAGFESTPNALAAADVSAQAQRFMVTMTASASGIVTKSPYMVRTSFTVYQLNATLGSWAAQNGVRKAYSLVADYSPGHDAEAAFQSAFKTAGGEIVGSARYPVANLDFSAFIQRALDSNPDGLYIWVPNGPQAIAVGKAIADRGIDKNKVKIMGQFTLTDEEVLPSMGDAAIGLITTSVYDYNNRTPGNIGFVEAYRAEFQNIPDVFAVGGYDGMHVIYESLKKTQGKADGEALIASAKGMRWDSPRGPVMVDPETRNLLQNVYVRRVEIVDGKIANHEFDSIKMVRDRAN